MQQLGPNSLTARQELRKEAQAFLKKSLLCLPENVSQIKSMDLTCK